MIATMEAVKVNSRHPSGMVNRAKFLYMPLPCSVTPHVPRDRGSQQAQHQVRRQACIDAVVNAGANADCGEKERLTSTQPLADVPHG
jgi:hypothetical protein